MTCKAEPGSFIPEVLLLVVALLFGCAPESRTQSKAQRANIASTEAFGGEDLLGGETSVIMRAMVEGEGSVELRSRYLNVPRSALKPRSYGLTIYELQTDSEIGASFLKVTNLYHMRELDENIVVDRSLYFCKGFISSQIFAVRQKGWSEYHKPEPGDIQRLETLAEAVRNGTGIRDAYNATRPFGSLGKYGSPEVNQFERETTWFSGLQDVEGVHVELLPSPTFGNRVATRFVQ